MGVNNKVPPIAINSTASDATTDRQQQPDPSAVALGGEAAEVVVGLQLGVGHST